VYQAALVPNHHLRQVLSFLNIYVPQQPEGYVGKITSVLDKEGESRQ